VDTLNLVLPAFAGMVRTMTVRKDELLRQAPLGFTLATEVADWLAVRGVPFKEAHEITGQLVQLCEAQEIGLEELTPAMLAQTDARLTPDVLEALTLDAALASRSGWGGTSPARVAEQIARFKQHLVAQEEWAKDYSGPRG
jgi:argininosuccinate lyase